MAKPEQSFEELLKSAPKHEDPPVSLTGWLSQSSDAKKFTLDFADGSSITLPISAVISHKLIAGSAGRSVVAVEIDRSAAGIEEKSAQSSPNQYGGTGVHDIGTGYYDVGTGHNDQGLGHSGHFLDIIPFGVPFGLATARQAPAEAILAMQGFSGPAMGTGIYDTTGYSDVYGTGVYDTHQTGLGDTGHFLDIIPFGHVPYGQAMPPWSR